jgi:hypothetical protein
MTITPALQWAFRFEQGNVREDIGVPNGGSPAILFMRGDKLPWCAGFVLTCTQLGQHLNDVSIDYWKNRNVDSFELWAQRKKMWFDAGQTPCAGDVIFFADRGLSDVGPGRHCGFVTGVGLDGDILTIEGNVGNRIQRRRYSPTDRRISGYARIKP